MPARRPGRRWRRRLAITAAVLAVVTVVASVAAVREYQGALRSNVGELDFANRLRIPPLLEPTVDAGGRRTFEPFTPVRVAPAPWPLLALPAAAVAAFNAGVIALVEPIRVDDDIRTVQLPITALTLVVVLAFLRRGGLHRLGGVALVALYAAFLLSLPAG